MSATVPMEFSFGTGGNLKSARRLRNLDLKKDRPTVHPLFGNTGSVVSQAYAAGASKPFMPSANSVSVRPPIGGRSSLPLKSGTKLINQGIASEQAGQQQTSGGELLQAPPSPSPLPEQQLQQQPQQQTLITPQKGGFFSSGKNVALAGGGLIAIVVIAMMLFGGKGKKRSSGRKSNNGNNAKQRRKGRTHR